METENILKTAELPRAVISGTKSRRKPVTTDVPQGVTTGIHTV